MTNAPARTRSHALITGSTSGIGAAFAEQLAAEGYDLVLVARTAERLREQSDQLAARHGTHAHVLPADLSCNEGIAKVAAFMDTQQVDVLINNAGYGLATSVLDTPIDDLLAMSTVLVRAVQVLSWHAARRMVQRGRGGIVTVTSVAAVTTMGQYAADKAAATIMMENLAVELAGTPVTATAVVPGFVRTNFHTAMHVRGPQLPEIGWLRPEFVARVGLADARRGAVLSVPGWQYTIAAGVGRVLPRWLMRGLSGGFSAKRSKTHRR